MSKWRSADAAKEAFTDESKDGAVVIDYKGQKGRAAHERKLLKKDVDPDSEGVVAKISTLQRGILSESTISAGNVQPTRLRVTGTMDSGVSFVYATGRQVFTAHAPIRLSDDDQAKVTLGTQGINISNIVQMKPPKCHPIVEDVLHTAEIQSLAHKESLVASVDARGMAVLYRSSSSAVDVIKDGASGESSRKKLKSTPTMTGHVLSGDGGTPELGWAGIAFNPLSSQLATAHSFTKAVRFYDSHTLQTTRAHTSLLMPTALAYSNTSTLVVAEYNQMSVWETKSHQRIAREGLPSLGCVHAVAWSPDGNSVALGGEDKVAYIYDTRKWKLRAVWRCPLKYDVAYLAFSPTDPSLCYVAGLDNELMVGKFDGSEKKKKDKHANEYSPTILQMNHRLGFRGDSRWVGLDVVQDITGDDLAIGACESGSVYAIHPAQHMLG
ncbi:hypothetical protein H310_09856 [Aphanomyces invadans]|uniref:Uncharacterized protein n=1 Tax=Aphanomyces invadans TaxID=157072 RepID=A0A024TTR5_9STRA|nr:hypothetical protein H310_09856 [Aphanomyces invadans]ETV97021.1 hypothetical protein H310_09856 [Aphanomyces invadans]|eukprot:XP_008874267.1 hypothetical protein H310_09856 [Aphanomyces invadans]